MRLDVAQPFMPNRVLVFAAARIINGGKCFISS
jgi:hypothetical protein